MSQRQQHHWLPAAGWLASYRRDDLRGDLTAGLTTAVVLVPQGMAYAMLAGLPPVYGLYASTIPLFIYALFGTSRELAVGPVAMVSLLVVASVSQLAEPGSPEFISAAITLAAMVGVIQLVLGLLRGGFTTNLLSHPVVSGFTAAAALIIGLSQLKHLLGLDLPRSHHVHEIVASAVARVGEIEPITLAIGAASIAFLVVLKRLWPRFPSALAVVILATVVVSVLGLQSRGVAIVGDVPAGLPAPQVPTFRWDLVTELAPTALTISLVAFIESISVARAFARRGRYDVDANRELFGLGLANLAGSFFGGYPVTGGFSRTAVNAEAGARTPLASIVTASVVTLTLLVLTPLFHSLPKAALAAIIMVAVFGLIDVKDVRHLWRVKRSDLGLFVITFAATLGLGMEEGILVGVGASILTFVVRTTHPHTAVLGRVPGTRVYRNIVNYPNALTTPGVITLRMDAQLYFGNVTFLKDALKRLEADLDVPLRAIVIDASSINQVDASADATLLEILERYEERGIGMYFAQCKGPVRQVMERSGLKEQIGEERFFLDLHDAVQAAAVHEPRSSSDERPVTPTSNPINPSPCQAPVNATP